MSRHVELVVLSCLLFCRLSMVGLAVSLADSDTFAAMSILELVADHCSEPFIPLSDLIPVWSSLFFPFVLYNFG